MFCKDGGKSCPNPIFPQCQDRTVNCGLDLPVHETMIRTNLSTNFSETPSSLGAIYSFTCKKDGWLIQTPGYPEEVIGKWWSSNHWHWWWIGWCFSRMYWAIWLPNWLDLFHLEPRCVEQQGTNPGWLLRSNPLPWCPACHSNWWNGGIQLHGGSGQAWYRRHSPVLVRQQL